LEYLAQFNEVELNLFGVRQFLSGRSSPPSLYEEVVDYSGFNISQPSETFSSTTSKPFDDDGIHISVFNIVCYIFTAF